MSTIQNYTISKPKLDLSQADRIAARRTATIGIQSARELVRAATNQPERKLAEAMLEAYSNLLALAWDLSKPK